MVRQLILRSVTLIFLMTGSSVAQNSERPRNGSMPTLIASPREPSGNVSEMKISVLDAVETGASATVPTPALFTEIVTWLTTNFDLPAIYEFPHVELVPATELAGKRIKHIPLGVGRENGFSNSAVQVAPQRTVVAVYNNSIKTIFLADSWTGRTPVEVSILVHEMVHHLQTLGNLKYECPGAREKPAYLAQDQWLKMFGMTLEKEFEIDQLTLLVMTACMI